MSHYGVGPLNVGPFEDIDLKEMMYYLYLPVMMRDETMYDVRLPDNVNCTWPLIKEVLAYCSRTMRTYQYVYLSARKGWATPDNPLNRPGWHCDGFGTDDLNFVWWKGPGTRFWVGDVPAQFEPISKDHLYSLQQFDGIARHMPTNIMSPPQKRLYAITPKCIHATPLIEQGCMRQYIKISCSNHRYNLADNSHNYLFKYDWPLHDRAEIRNDTDKAQRDYI